MYNFCTLFDSNYLTRGLAMYESLKEHCKNFHLYIFAFDDISCHLLKKLELEFVTVISLNEFEDKELVNVKNSRTKSEYCWTCTPSVIKYCLEKYNLKSCTYLDADIYFFDNPNVFFDELGENSILITRHNYTLVYDRSSVSGIYCVQFVTFKNDERGIKVLNWWRNACIDWCYARYENGKFGDQKYLDAWTNIFEGVHVLKHLGTIAPWNVQQYEFMKREGNKIILRDKKTKNLFNTIFYHFHSLNFISNDIVDFGPYILQKWVLEEFYKPYLRKLCELNEFLRKEFNLTLYTTKNQHSKMMLFFVRVNFLKFFFLNFFNKFFCSNKNIFNNKIVKHLVMGYNLYKISSIIKKRV